ncbi:MAG: hypothetical protein JRI95_17095 [Deltaproteobacteria bacterium]|nr:hypothetical protein [Deltaproteobacteria bacterium]
MDKVIPFSDRPCRYLKHGRCSNHFWQIMKSSGKPGLKDYLCIHWQNKLNKVEQYWDAVWRADRFGLQGLERQKAIDRIISRRPPKEVICPDFRFDPDSPTGQCRYHFLQACLLKFPECREQCEDYVPEAVGQGAKLPDTKK